MISIVIVNYNGLKWLDKCLGSFTNQTYSDLEIILVDNNSSDESIRFTKQNFPSVKIIESKKNLGFAGGNNLGIKATKGEYILLVNSDTWADRDFVNNLFVEYQTRKLDVLGPLEYKYDGTQIAQVLSQIDLFGHPYIAPLDDPSQKSFYLSGVCLLFKKSLYEETLGLDENYFMYVEEVDWFWRLNLMQKTFGYTDKAVIYHAGAGSTGGGIKYNVFLWRNQNTLQTLLKNYKVLTLLWVLPIYFVQNIVEIIFFLVFLKPKISQSYLQGWWFNLSHLKIILKNRKWVQRHRQISDRMIREKMFFGFGKIHHLLKFYF